MIDLLRTFLAVVDGGGVTPAAAALNMSQAAASQQVKRLEEMLDCRLFERVGRRLVLAPAGERLLAQAQRLVSQAGRDWRAVCEVSRLEPVHAAIEAGLAVAPLLRSSVPERFEILGREARLPALPEFQINLYAPPGPSPAARDLAEHVRAAFLTA